MKTIRFGIIGCGGMMKTHIQNIQLVEHVVVTAFADVDIEKAQALASIAPDARSIVTAVSSKISVGAKVNTNFKPSAAPLNSRS